jgi:cation diffusion facilitator CzcD-associated flavoprotein CzcO
MYRLLDADSYRGQRVLVVGGGDSAVEAAIGLSGHPDNRVTLSYRRERLMRVKRVNEDRYRSLVRDRRLHALYVRFGGRDVPAARRVGSGPVPDGGAHLLSRPGYGIQR